jgi:DNA adenine methylase
MRYHGGKWTLAPWLISLFPPHRVYVEPFGGGASVLLRKRRSYAEVYNDLDGEVVNVFRVLRDPVTAARLAELIELTPFARCEFLGAYQIASDPIEAARRTIVKSFMGFGSAAITSRGQVTTPEGMEKFKAPTGFRSNSNRSGTTPAHDWHHYPDGIPQYVERMRGVVIENRAASDVIATHDSPTTLFYVDPPYLAETRDSGTDYRHEMTQGDHEQLCDALRSVVGMVLVSGYPSAVYEHLYAGWYCVDRPHFSDGAGKRTEVVWMNEAAQNATSQLRLVSQ